MNKIKNIEGITKITMFPVAYTICAIGKDWFKSELEIVFEPGDCYPDYMEVNRFIMEEVDGKEMNIEEVVDRVYEFLDGYAPRRLVVTDHVKGCRTHFNVDVVKE